eukprot:gene13001-biopygen7979
MAVGLRFWPLDDTLWCVSGIARQRVGIRKSKRWERSPRGAWSPKRGIEVKGVHLDAGWAGISREQAKSPGNSLVLPQDTGPHKIGRAPAHPLHATAS